MVGSHTPGHAGKAEEIPADDPGLGRLAERYRPTRFREVVGQETAVKYLRALVQEEVQPPGAVLLSGPFGTGKTTLARILAAGLNCEDPKTGEPCLACLSCRSFETGTSLGLHPLNAGAQGGVEVVRDLADRLMYYSHTKMRIVFLDEAQAFSNQAYEALLDLLETPPLDTLFVLATTEETALPDTVLSRLERIALRPVPASAIRARLQLVADREGIEVSADALDEIARRAVGSIRDSLNMLEQAAVLGVKDLAGLRDILPVIARERPDQQTDGNPLTVVTARQLCSAAQAEKPRELLGSLVVGGDRIVLGARTGHGKTTLALQVLRSIVVGADFLGWKGIGGARALFIDAEQRLRTLKRRLEEMGIDDRDDVHIVRVPDGLALDRDRRRREELERLLSEGGYDLVVADPLYMLHRGDSNDERSAVDLMRILDRWRNKYGFALILTAHSRKAPSHTTKVTLDELFGSSAYLRGAEVVLGLERRTGGPSRLTFLKDRDGGLPYGESWPLEFNRESGYRRASEEASRKFTSVDRVRDALNDQGGLTIRELCKRTGNGDKTVRTALKNLGAVSSGPRRDLRWQLVEPKTEAS